MQEGIQVEEIFVENMDLEKYFLRAVGGAADVKFNSGRCL